MPTDEKMVIGMLRAETSATRRGMNGVICFQETYNHEHYKLYHPRGMKSKFEWRCDGFDRMSICVMAVRISPASCRSLSQQDRKSSI